jgi:hypothetical protein
VPRDALPAGHRPHDAVRGARSGDGRIQPQTFEPLGPRARDRDRLAAGEVARFARRVGENRR